VVARGYDAAARRYLEWSALRPSEARLATWPGVDLIPPGARVLELAAAPASR
jgi:hypothetical protein